LRLFAKLFAQERLPHYYRPLIAMLRIFSCRPASS